MRNTFIVFDIETTGLEPSDCGITEIGAVKLNDGEIIGEFSTYVNPERPIPAESTQLTGISDETVKDAPKIGEALCAFFNFAGDFTLVAHGAEKFEMPFISRCAAKCGIKFANPYLDTLAMSRDINKDLKKHTFKALLDFYKVEDFEYNRAVDAARALAQIFVSMNNIIVNGAFVEFLMKESDIPKGEVEWRLKGDRDILMSICVSIVIDEKVYAKKGDSRYNPDRQDMARRILKFYYNEREWIDEI